VRRRQTASKGVTAKVASNASRGTQGLAVVGFPTLLARTTDSCAGLGDQAGLLEAIRISKHTSKVGTAAAARQCRPVAAAVDLVEEQADTAPLAVAAVAVTRVGC